MFQLNSYVYVSNMPGVHRIISLTNDGQALVAPCEGRAPYKFIAVSTKVLREMPKKEKPTHTKREYVYINQIKKAALAAGRRKSAMRYDADRIRKCKDFMEAALGYRPKDLMTGIRDIIMMSGRNEGQLAAEPYTILYESLEDATGHSKV